MSDETDLHVSGEVGDAHAVDSDVPHHQRSSDLLPVLGRDVLHVPLRLFGRAKTNINAKAATVKIGALTLGQLRHLEPGRSTPHSDHQRERCHADISRLLAQWI